ncbi:hypothetical protein TFKS16_0437 [Tannerella forsythia KS16]|jgi:hypothetical protein|uniref:Uncharacterized protein n=2 Tax=Tannerella forsythia TaxID=28112 RepID=G8ULC4_TANFA|nr:hypothetical protein BFO_0504 [Tannerella forsythia 92A2]BAR48047.1 hypothetical protein TF3313_0464 [Tannerella forsythia 3313]BAR50750.1 hypothetical protein TFKS16_0437 [Tannerella forsythia KS16]SCQ18326.1 hypothetical protein TFUB4_00379 [Tannerella forsythia]SCQ18788.1 hypothetical protein TFUB20_00465 [Tannerella forsythia]
MFPSKPVVEVIEDAFLAPSLIVEFNHVLTISLEQEPQSVLALLIWTWRSSSKTGEDTF